ncbi:MAG TPA: DNA-directed RNA polymerase subunit omega [Clostridiales bacterium]|nr:DNA-directed RNA polymerase subunit omega [Clostridiales bacterium]
MVKPSVEELMKSMDSRYTLVVTVAKRARQIVDGAGIQIRTASAKPVSIAIQEVALRKVGFTRKRPQPSPAILEEENPEQKQEAALKPDNAGETGEN